MVKQNLKRKLFWLAVVLSIYGLITSPGQQIIDQLTSRSGGVALGIALSEATLTVGYAIMLLIAAPAAARELFRTFSGMISLRRLVRNFDWSAVADKCNSSPIFWLGFWLSVAGACGDGITLIIAIGGILPLRAWGLMIFPFWDLGLTFVIRRGILKAVRKG